MFCLDLICLDEEVFAFSFSKISKNYENNENNLNFDKLISRINDKITVFNSI